MVGIKIQGRLGNQLFQYAFIYTVSKKLKTSFYFDQYNERFVLNKYFKVELSRTEAFLNQITGINGFKSLFSFHFKRFIYKHAPLIIKLKSENYDWKETDAVEVLNNINDQTLFIGYFQSYLYFKMNQSEIFNLFTLKPKYQNAFHQKYSHLYKKPTTICVHVRRTDFLDLSGLNLGDKDLSLPLTYFKIAMDMANKNNAVYVFITDDINFVTKHFGDVKNKFISNDTEIMDFQHLLNADICIISNSTFSWWGAWLNKKPGKIIYAPKYYLGWRIKKETPKDIYPKEWVQIDF